MDALNSDQEFVAAYLSLDTVSIKTSRRVRSFFDMLGAVGGVYNSLFLVGMIFVSIFSERLFIGGIISKIYQ